jgi:hypothetical protein
MEKRNLKSFLLYRIARRLQNWSNFLLKQAEEMDLPVQSENMVSNASTTRVALKPTSTQGKDMANTIMDSPPTHWLAHVASTGKGENGIVFRSLIERF